MNCLAGTAARSAGAEARSASGSAPIRGHADRSRRNAPRWRRRPTHSAGHRGGSTPRPVTGPILSRSPDRGEGARRRSRPAGATRHAYGRTDAHAPHLHHVHAPVRLLRRRLLGQQSARRGDRQRRACRCGLSGRRSTRYELTAADRADSTAPRASTTRRRRRRHTVTRASAGFARLAASAHRDGLPLKAAPARARHGSPGTGELHGRTAGGLAGACRWRTHGLRPQTCVPTAPRKRMELRYFHAAQRSRTSGSGRTSAATASSPARWWANARMHGADELPHHVSPFINYSVALLEQITRSARQSGRTVTIVPMLALGIPRRSPWPAHLLRPRLGAARRRRRRVTPAGGRRWAASWAACWPARAD